MEKASVSKLENELRMEAQKNKRKLAAERKAYKKALQEQIRIRDALKKKEEEQRNATSFWMKSVKSPTALNGAFTSM